jgi:23S rRNA methylase
LKKNRFSKNWIIKQKRDVYVKKSKLEGYRSRAVYKLEEINNKFKIIKNNSLVIDLGAAPGSWSQFISRNFNNSKIISIDLKDIEPIKNLVHIKGDFTDEKHKINIKNYFGKKVDLIISDMAVNTTGNKSVDSLVTGELCIDAMHFAIEY